MASNQQKQPLTDAQTLMSQCDTIIDATLSFLEAEKQKVYKNINVKSLENDLVTQKILFGFCKTAYEERRAGSRNSNEDNVLKMLEPVKVSLKKVQGELRALLQTDEDGALEEAEEKTEVAFDELAGSVEKLRDILPSP
ncbi:hypothetical protein CABS01_03117 [Colletotrichum abscissum]|uniref:Uncharacterized protein n=1 Tax=Colletotrichum abscissum TaxID=1671311 RepID=A0A9Q0AX98_9PEZI|nr:uncharacterized protein CABS01_03117 [Colletotrichum abscissum]KAI3529827.1 hypothetical protein CABS02_14703 [Colletotrichum abscissum]KAK1477815.1 hypothetical protein CABS01_03117 [Colletotrichum abscissum]